MSSLATPVLSGIEELHTVADLERRCANGERFELVLGRLREMPPAGGEHGSITKRLDTILTVFVYERDLGECFTAETGFLVTRNPDTVLAPDWAFVRTERLPTPIPKSFVNLAPDIVLETRSPSETTREVEEKTTLWLEVGVEVVLNLDPGRSILMVHRRSCEPEFYESDGVLELRELPGLCVPLRATLRW